MMLPYANILYVTVEYFVIYSYLTLYEYVSMCSKKYHMLAVSIAYTTSCNINVRASYYCMGIYTHNIPAILCRGSISNHMIRI